MRWEILGTLILAVSASIASADELPRDTNSIQQLTVEQAEEVVRQTSGYGDLELNGLQSLTQEVASVLAKWFGLLWLNRVESLSDQAAEALASHEGGMSLGVVPLSDGATDAPPQPHRAGLLEGKNLT